VTIKLNIKLRKDAYSLAALIDAGVPVAVARKLLVAQPSRPERPRVSVTGRKRDPETTEYIWGPDASVLLQEEAQAW
jgi:hypothetical protein